MQLLLCGSNRPVYIPGQVSKQRHGTQRAVASSLSLLCLLLPPPTTHMLLSDAEMGTADSMHFRTQITEVHFPKILC